MESSADKDEVVPAVAGDGVSAEATATSAATSRLRDSVWNSWVVC
jgi:hypothetical protein